MNGKKSLRDNLMKASVGLMDALARVIYRDIQRCRFRDWVGLGLFKFRKNFCFLNWHFKTNFNTANHDSVI